MGTVTEILESLKKNKLFAYFLILWGIVFLGSALSGLMYVADWYVLDELVEVMESLAEIGCMVILVMLGLKILQKK
jgi:hypothetical protein